MLIKWRISTVFLLYSMLSNCGDAVADNMLRDMDGMQLAWVKIPAKVQNKQPDNKPVPVHSQKTAPQSVAAPKSPAPEPPLIPAISATENLKPLPASNTAPVIAPSSNEPLRFSQPPKAISSVPALAVLPEPTRTSDQPPENAWVISAGYETGGDELGSFKYTDGSTATAYANTGFIFRLGKSYRNGDQSSFYTHVSIGYKYGGPKILNTDISWSAIPLEAIEQYRTGSLIIGMGANYQLHNQYTVNLSTGGSKQYDNSLGMVLQLAWMPAGEFYGIEFRHTRIQFRQSEVVDPPAINGNVSGFSLMLRF